MAVSVGIPVELILIAYNEIEAVVLISLVLYLDKEV